MIEEKSWKNRSDKYNMRKITQLDWLKATKHFSVNSHWKFLNTRQADKQASEIIQILFILLGSYFNNGLVQKKIQMGGWGYTFLKTLLEIFNFFTLPLEIVDKTKLSPWIFHKIVLDPLEIPKPKTQADPLEFPHYFFLVTL